MQPGPVTMSAPAQPITYRGRLARSPAPDRFFLADHLDERPPDDPDRRMVLHMRLCAHEIAAGQLPGPYTDPGARCYARGCLLAPGVGELLEGPLWTSPDSLDVSRLARAVGVPQDELRLEVPERRRFAAR